MDLPGQGTEFPFSILAHQVYLDNQKYSIIPCIWQEINSGEYFILEIQRISPNLNTPKNAHPEVPVVDCQ